MIDFLNSIITAVTSLDNSYLCIQGPPGSGKTFTAKNIIGNLITQKKRVGISSNSHKAILNLMGGVADYLIENQIEGEYKEGQSVVLIEDLISTGKSSIEAINTLRNSKLNVKGVASIFSYGFTDSLNNFKDINSEYISLCTYDYLLEEALKSQYISKDDFPILKEWRKNPSIWKK